MSRILASTLLLLLCLFATAQPEKCGFTIVKGANLSFNVNSFSKAKNGITYEDFTIIRISFKDVTEGSTGWELFVRSLNENLKPDFGSRELPLDVLRIKATCGDYSFFVNDLTTANKQIACWQTGFPLDGSTVDVVISYELGTENCNEKLTGYISDYFTADLEFTLSPR